ncbi:hypothetical protein C9421_29690, partial [Klebsiella pneumoniae]
FPFHLRRRILHIKQGYPMLLHFATLNAAHRALQAALRLPLTPPLQQSLCSFAQGNGVCQVDGLTA